MSAEVIKPKRYYNFYEYQQLEEQEHIYEGITFPADENDGLYNQL